MGVSGGINGLLNKRAPECKEPLNPTELSNQTVSVDAMGAIYSSITSAHNQTQNGHINGIFNKCMECIVKKIHTIWVFDGAPPCIKRGTIAKRKQNKADAKAKLDSLPVNNRNTKKRSRLKKQTCSVTSEQVKDIQDLLDLLGIPNFQINGPLKVDAEALCSAFSKYVISNDWDTLLFKGNIMLKDFWTNNPIKITLKTLLEKLDLTLAQYIDLCIILGTDYCDPIHGLNATSAYDLYYNFKNLENFVNHLKEVNDERLEYNMPEKYLIPDHFLIRANVAKEYFLTTLVLDPEDPAINIMWKKPNQEKLIEFLCDTHKLDRNKILHDVNKIMQMYSEYEHAKSRVPRKSINGNHISKYTNRIEQIKMIQRNEHISIKTVPKYIPNGVFLLTETEKKDFQDYLDQYVYN